MVRVSAYISTIISAAADEGTDEMNVFPGGSTLFINFPSKNVQNITEIDMSLCELFQERILYIAIYANFSEKGCLYIAIYANFSKREKEWIGRPAGDVSFG